MAVEDQAIETLDQILVLPTAGNIFELKDEDFYRFRSEVAKLFGRHLIDWYSLDKAKGLWLLQDNNMKLRGIERSTIAFGRYVEINHLHPSAISLKFIRDSAGKYPTPEFLMDFRGKPRFAFLEDKIDPNKSRGLYLSVGSPDNPWANREERIYVVQR